MSWRAESPAHLLGGKLCFIPEEGGYYALTQPNDDSAFRWGFDATLEDGTRQRILSPEAWSAFTATRPRLTELTQIYLDHEGSAVWTRPDICRATHAKAMREQHGIRTVAEVDDNYLSHSKFNVYMRQTGWDDTGRLDHLKALASMDAVVFSTVWLRDRYHKAFKERFGKIGTELHVCGNHIDSRYLVQPVPPRDDGKLRIGYMGSGQHVADIQLIEPALTWAARQGHEIVFVGIDPLTSNKAWADWPYTHVPWQKPADYKRMALPLDIGLAPLVVNDHTLGKSDIKNLEYALSGAAGVVQNCEVYSRSMRHGETALLAGSPAEFLYWTQQLVRRPDLRAQIANGCREYIFKERLIEQHRHEWEAAVLG